MLPERWQCVPFAFSLVTGISMESLLQRLGHDGSKIIDEQMPEPFRRRGFACQEILSILPEFGWVGTFLAIQARIDGYATVSTHYTYKLNYAQSGVMYLSARMHAVAWINGQMLDMNGVCQFDSGIIAYVPLFKIEKSTSCQNQIIFETRPKF